MLGVETWAAVSEESERRRGYVLDSWLLIAVVRAGVAGKKPEVDLTGGGQWTRTS